APTGPERTPRRGDSGPGRAGGRRTRSSRGHAPFGQRRSPEPTERTRRPRFGAGWGGDEGARMSGRRREGRRPVAAVRTGAAPLIVSLAACLLLHPSEGRAAPVALPNFPLTVDGAVRTPLT